MADSAKAKDKNPHAPNLKTWVLRVTIHCEGCKKKVKRIVDKTEGLVDSNIDLKQQKVTVTGNNIDVNGLIARLIKRTGKSAELWPEVKRTEPQPKEKKQSNNKPKPTKEKLQPPITIEVKPEDLKSNEEGGPVKEKSKTEAPVVQNQVKKSTSDEEAAKSPAVKSGQDTEVKNPPTETKPEENGSTKASKSTEKVEAEETEQKQNDAVEGAAEGGASDNVVKKKKKGQSGKQKVVPPEEEEEDAARSQDVSTRESKQRRQARNISPPRQQYPPYYYGPPPGYHAHQPIYTVSYNTTTPYQGSSSGPTYYAAPPPHTQQGYTSYSSGPSSMQYPPSDYGPYQSQPSDSFEMFSDENPNACSLM